MNFWDFAWIGWIAFMAVADVIADRAPGRTFSEHVQAWFGSFYGRVVLGAFFLALYLHFAFRASVWPVVYLGALVVVFIARWYWLRRKHGKPAR